MKRLGAIVAGTLLGGAVYAGEPSLETTPDHGYPFIQENAEKAMKVARFSDSTCRGEHISNQDHRLLVKSNNSVYEILLLHPSIGDEFVVRIYPGGMTLDSVMKNTSNMSSIPGGVEIFIDWGIDGRDNYRGESDDRQNQYLTALDEIIAACEGGNQQVQNTVQEAPKQLTLQEMLSVKAEIKEADSYTARNLPGNALIHLFKAQQIAGSANFTEELAPRIESAKRALPYSLPVYPVTFVVQDATNSGRAEYIQFALQDQQYGLINVVPSGGTYTLTLELRALDVDEKKTAQSHVIMIPVGTSKSFNGEYETLKKRVDIACANYFAQQEAARGAGTQAARGAWDFSQAVKSKSLVDAFSSGVSMLDAEGKIEAQDTAAASCNAALAQLEATPMYTSDTQTAPFQYEERVTRMTATAGIRFSLSSGNTKLFTSPPLDIDFVREDLYRPNIPAAHIRGDPLEEITEKEVIRGVLQAIPKEIYKQTQEGRILGDIIATKHAEHLTGDAATEAWVQVLFGASSEEAKHMALRYIVSQNHLSIAYGSKGEILLHGL